MSLSHPHLLSIIQQHTELAMKLRLSPRFKHMEEISSMLQRDLVLKASLVRFMQNTGTEKVCNQGLGVRRYVKSVFTCTLSYTISR